MISLEAQAECRKSARITLMEAEKDISRRIFDDVAQSYSHDDIALTLRKMHLTYEGMQDNDGALVVPSAYSDGFNVKPGGEVYEVAERKAREVGGRNGCAQSLVRSRRTRRVKQPSWGTCGDRRPAR